MDFDLIFSFFLIFSGAAVLATFALFTRQPLLIAFIALGMLFGPYGMGFVTQLDTLQEISEIGILFLLFLLGLDMQPSTLINMLKKVTVVTLASAFIFSLTGFLIALSFQLSLINSLIIGIAMIFSSTIISIKLLPTTILHHKHMGELMVGILLLQDILAIIVLIFLQSGNALEADDAYLYYIKLILALPFLFVTAILGVKYVIIKLITKFDRFHEYIFLLPIGWCLGFSELAGAIGLSQEIGAFIAGVALATSPIAQYIALNLKPLRDFFLILFFFALGAGFNISILDQIWLPCLVLALTMLALKPLVFKQLLGRFSERRSLSWDIGFRLGQNSEFSLLIAFLATSKGLIDANTSFIIQGTAIITFIISSYIVVFNYPTPIGFKDHLRRD